MPSKQLHSQVNRKIMNHQYIDRHTQQVCDEQLYGDRFVRALYSSALERPNFLISAVSSQWVSNALSMLSYNTLLASSGTSLARFLDRTGVNLTECVEPAENLDSARKVFERKIKFWSCRPMPIDPAVVCPADARVIVGSLRETSSVFIKEKFFNFDELLGLDHYRWRFAFANGDFALFRLTPEKYHYIHVPVAGQ